MLVDNGIFALKEFPKLRSSIRIQVADIDVAAAYPTGEDIANVSHETTFREVSKIEGVSDEERREIGINLTGSRNNALSFCRTVYKTPKLPVLLEQYQESKQNVTKNDA